MRITKYNNMYTNQVSNEVVDEIIARMDALSALNRNVSSFGSSKQFYAVRDSKTAKPELLRKFQEWRDTKVAYGEVRAFRRVSSCCKGKLVKNKEAAPFVVSVMYDDPNNMVPGMSDTAGTTDRKSYGDIKYSVADGLNKPSFYNNQPQAFLQAISVTNEGYAGSVQKVRLRMRVFTREAFEVIDKWFLRPGNEILVKFGWSVALSSNETATEVIHAAIFNFNATLTDDMGWDITIHGIAKGNVAVGLSLGATANPEAITFDTYTDESQYTVPDLTSVLKQQLTQIQTVVPTLATNDIKNELTPDDTDGQGGRHGVIYSSTVFPHGIGRIKFLTEAIEPAIQTSDMPAFDTEQDPNKTVPASDEQFNEYITQLINKDDGGFFKEKFTDYESWKTADDASRGPDALKGKNVASGDRGATLVRYFQNNFGYIDPDLSAAYVYPSPYADEGFYKKSLWLFYQKPDVFGTTRYWIGGGKATRPAIQLAAGVFDILLDQSGQANPTDRRLGINNAKDLPPTPGLRRRVWEEMLPYLGQIAKNLAKSAMSDEERKQVEALEKAIKEQEDKTNQAVSAQENLQKQLAEQAGQDRITNPQSIASYYICLGDLVYYFNDLVFTQAPELYDTVQIAVENQITTYDPNIVSCIPHEIMFSNALNYEGGMSRYGSIEYGFLRKREFGVIYTTGTGAGETVDTTGGGPVAWSGNSGIKSSGPHLHMQWSSQVDGGRRVMTDAAADKYIRCGGKPPSSYVTVKGGEYGAPRDGGRRRHKGLDYAMPIDTPITLVPGSGASTNGKLFWTDAGGHQMYIDTPEGKLVIAHLQKRGVSGNAGGGSGIVINGDMQLVDAVGADGVTYLNTEYFDFDSMSDHNTDWGVDVESDPNAPPNRIAAFNIAHIWVSIDLVNQLYSTILRDTAIDPQYKTVLLFFESLFAKIAEASGNIMQLTFAPDINELYDSAKKRDPINVKTTSKDNPLLTQTHMLRIVDANHQLPFNLGPKTLSFKANDVNTTLLRDLNITMKLPSKMQTVAYTFGRQGLNDDIIDINDEHGICEVDSQKLVQTRNDVIQRLDYWKAKVGIATSQENLENLQSALNAYAQNPIPMGVSGDDTSRVQVAHQGWIFSRLYPIELQLKMDGISGFQYGNKIDVVNALPSRYSDSVFFTLSKIEHEVAENDWITTITGIARLKYSNAQLQFPRVFDKSKEECGGTSETDGGSSAAVNTETTYGDSSNMRIVNGAITSDSISGNTGNGVVIDQYNPSRISTGNTFGVLQSDVNVSGGGLTAKSISPNDPYKAATVSQPSVTIKNGAITTETLGPR